ncbi:MAG: hypothetical protein QXN56_07015 [Candidatus Hadarchaeum sp.]
MRKISFLPGQFTGMRRILTAMCASFSVLGALGRAMWLQLQAVGELTPRLELARLFSLSLTWGLALWFGSTAVGNPNRAFRHVALGILGLCLAYLVLDELRYPLGNPLGTITSVGVLALLFVGGVWGVCAANGGLQKGN